MTIARRLALSSLLVVSTLAAYSVAGDVPTTKPVYPLKTCIVSGEELGGDMGKPVVLQYEGREVQFCCGSCVKAFKKEPMKYLKKLDDAIAAQAATQPSTKPA